MTHSTVSNPKNTMSTLVGRYVQDIIDPPDSINYLSCLDKVFKTQEYEFAAYTVGNGAAHFIALMIPYGDEVVVAELLSKSPENRPFQKQLLLKSVSGLIKLKQPVTA